MLRDPKTSLFWVIPCSSQINKYEKIIHSRKAKNKPHNHIQIIKVSGKKQAFLYQDMFPILPHYFEKEYANQLGIFEIKDPKLIQKIEVNAIKIIKLLKNGVRFTPTQPNIHRIEALMLYELEHAEDLVAATREEKKDTFL